MDRASPCPVTNVYSNQIHWVNWLVVWWLERHDRYWYQRSYFCMTNILIRQTSKQHPYWYWWVKEFSWLPSSKMHVSLKVFEKKKKKAVVCNKTLWQLETNHIEKAGNESSPTDMTWGQLNISNYNLVQLAQGNWFFIHWLLCWGLKGYTNLWVNRYELTEQFETLFSKIIAIGSPFEACELAKTSAKCKIYWSEMSRRHPKTIPHCSPELMVRSSCYKHHHIGHRTWRNFIFAS